MNINQYSDHLKNVVQGAYNAAVKYQTYYIGSEHIVLAMLQEKGCEAYNLLTNAGVSYQRFFELFRSNLNHRSASKRDFTPNTKALFNLAEEFAIQEADLNWLVGTEHVLLAILTVTECFAYDLLKLLQVDFGRLTEETERKVAPDSFLDEDEPQPPKPQKPEPERKYGFTKLPNVLEDYGVDLTQKAREGKLDPVIGRRKEIEKVVQILSRRTKNNPVLIGEPGVGKSAVVEGLALAIVQGEVPDLLREKIVYSLNITGLLAGTRYRGDFEERLKKVIDAIVGNKSIILFIDEIHMIVGAGGTSDSPVDASNILKPMLARGELQTVGATTIEEYRKFIEKDAALERRFTPVEVSEPSVEDTVTILNGLRDRYEAHHKVEITDEAIEAAARLSDRYIPDRYLPDKAIDLIDEAASHARLTSFNGPAEIHETEENLRRLYADYSKACKWKEYERAEGLNQRIEATEKRLSDLKESWKRKRNSTKVAIGAEEIAEVVSDWTGVPVAKLNETEGERLLRLEDEIHARIVGQDEAVFAVARAIRRARAGLKDPGRPIGSFIFVGPTGVGKTDLAKALAQSMFGDERLMIRLDMSEYMEKNAVSKLIGAPPGYVGYDDTDSTLTERVRRKPYSVVLFDEIEKAHPDVFNLLLQILDDGRLTDSKGRLVSFKNTVIILTSNTGAQLAAEAPRLGFRTETDDDGYRDMKEQINAALKQQFRPEFLNRIDEIVIFRKLTREETAKICDKILRGLATRMRSQEIGLSVTERARDYLVREGYSEESGARPLKRAVQKYVEDRLSEEILRGNVSAGTTVTVDESDGELKFTVIRS